MNAAGVTINPSTEETTKRNYKLKYIAEKKV